MDIETIKCRIDCKYYIGDVEGLAKFGDMGKPQRIFVFGSTCGSPVFVVESLADKPNDNN